MEQQLHIKKRRDALFAVLGTERFLLLERRSGTGWKALLAFLV